VQVDVTCSGGGTTYSETKIFDGTAVNNPYLSTSPTLVSFNNLTISADHTCAAGQTWNLTVRNTTTGNGTRNVLVYPVSSGNNSYISLPSLTIINVDLVSGYTQTYPSVSTPPTGYFGGGDTVYVRADISDPFGSFDINSATVTIKKPDGTAMVTDAAMTEKADSGTSTKTYEYAYAIPTSGPEGSWTAIVTAHEGTEGTVSDDGTGFFNVGMPNLTVVKSVQVYSDPVNGTTSPKAIPGAFMLYTILVTNTGHGSVDSGTTVITDRVPDNIELFVGDLGGGIGPVAFADGTTASGLCYDYANPGACTGDNLEFSSTPHISAPPYNYGYTPTADGNGCDPNVTNVRITFGDIFDASDGTNNPSFNVRFRVRVK
jgi:hypothetical protein